MPRASRTHAGTSVVRALKAVRQQASFNASACALEPRGGTLTQLPDDADSSPTHPLIMNRPAGSKSLRGRKAPPNRLAPQLRC